MNNEAKSLLKSFEDLKGAKFIGIKAYNSKTTGEIANHVLLANFDYGNAVNKDLGALNNATKLDIIAINEKYGFSTELIETAIDKLKTSFVKNQNKETQSNQSKAQSEIYYHITNSVKLHKETLKVHIFALHVSKIVLQPATIETASKNSRELTLCQNSVKKYFAFSTSKYRQFIVDKNHITSDISISGETYVLV